MNQTKSKSITEASRSMMMTFFQSFMLGVIQRMRDKYVKTMDPELGQASQDVSEDAVLLVTLLKVLRDEGTPADVVFIARSGQRISLKTDKDLTENDLVNLLLDNKTLKTAKCR